jgi:enolase-phosphatase E1
VTPRLAAQGIRLVLLDIEGTTTPLAFVRDVLFPFACRHLSGWLREHAGTPERAAAERQLREEHDADRRRGESPPAWDAPSDGSGTDGLVAYVTWLMDRDRKSPGLKTLQGLVWDDGYARGELHGEIYPDVAPSLERWHREGIDIAIYSSGSELAQRRLFASAREGDLTPLIAGFFDTAVGSKRDPASYRLIAAALGHEPGRVLFLSDATGELEAAAAAGCRTGLSLRPENPPQDGAERFDRFTSFDEIA